MSRMDWHKLLSTKRVSQFDACGVVTRKSQFVDPRHPFERDYDQIIFSYPFRRLQDKTQVIPFPEYDFVHTRLTHSLEVASVGRSLGKLAAKLIFKELGSDFIKEQNLTNSDIGSLVASACLAHDIGNPPFGHSGESSISYYFKNHYIGIKPRYNLQNLKEETETEFHFEIHTHNGPYITSYDKSEFIQKMKFYTDLSEFEGNANGFRILTQNCDRGINLTAALLGTFSKYPKESYIYPNPYADTKQPKSFSKYGFFQSEKEIFKQLASELGLIQVDGIEQHDVAFCRHPLCYLMEAADDIAYGIIDFEDGCRLGIIDFEKKYGKITVLSKKNKLEEINIDSSPLEILIQIASIDNSFDLKIVERATDFKQAISYLRSKVINVLVNECFRIFEEKYSEIMSGKFENSLIDEITDELIVSSLKKMKALVRKYVYNYSPVLQSEASGFEVMSKLIEVFAISSDICISCGDNETERASKLKSLLPEEYRPNTEKELEALSTEEIYLRLRRVMDYVSGMTDNYAISLYRKISGVSY